MSAMVGVAASSSGSRAAARQCGLVVVTRLRRGQSTD